MVAVNAKRKDWDEAEGKPWVSLYDSRGVVSLGYCQSQVRSRKLKRMRKGVDLRNYDIGTRRSRNLGELWRILWLKVSFLLCCHEEVAMRQERTSLSTGKDEAHCGLRFSASCKCAFALAMNLLDPDQEN